MNLPLQGNWRAEGKHPTGDKGTFINLLQRWAIIGLLSVVPLAYPQTAYTQQLNYDLQPQTTTQYPDPPETLKPGINANVVVADPEAERIATANWEAEQAKQKALMAKKASPKVVLPYDPCSCVSYAKWLSGINVGSMSLYGAGIGAKNHPVNSATPVVGGLAVFKSGVGMSSSGHLAVVIDVQGNLITTKGANEISCVAGTISHYDLGLDYWKFKGFYNP